MATGVYQTTKKDGSIYYRVSLTYHNKHINLDSFATEKDAIYCYEDAKRLLADSSITIENFISNLRTLSFEKAISLLNFRDNGIYIKTPIYLYKNFFTYHLSESFILKFDNDDLFYYSSHRIFARNGYLFVNDYGTQYNIASRYGIKNYAVLNRDYRFVNGDSADYRYANIEIINRYYGVSSFVRNNRIWYEAKIHLNGDIIIGRYTKEIKAAIAYNKAIDYARDLGYVKNFMENYITELSPKEYADVYTRLHLTEKCKTSIQRACEKKS